MGIIRDEYRAVFNNMYVNNIIYYDARWIGAHGIGRFAAELHSRLHLRQLHISGSPSSPVDPLRMVASMLRLPRRVIIFSPGYNAPLALVRPYVLTVHDLNHIAVRENRSVAKRLYYHLVLRSACLRARRVLTVSDFSRRQIIDWSGVQPDKVVNVGNGVGPAYRPDGERYEAGYPYLLCVSNRKPHKNELRLIEAFSRAQIDPRVRLLFTGGARDELNSAIRRCGVAGRIGFLGRIEEERLPSLYRGSLALVFPSLYEGFGLPVLEAMACGTPVLTSGVASLPEVAGGAALLVDPLSIDEIAAGIKRICEDHVLRRELRAAGLQRSADFSWDRVAERVSHVLKDVIDETFLSTHTSDSAR